MRRTTLMGRLAGENCPSYAACGTSYGKKPQKKPPQVGQVPAEAEPKGRNPSGKNNYVFIANRLQADVCKKVRLSSALSSRSFAVIQNRCIGR